MARKSSSVPLNRQIIEEAATWFVDFRVGDVDARTREEFSRWLRRSPEHIRAYLEISDTYVGLPPGLAEGKFAVEQLVSHARGETNVLPLCAPLLRHCAPTPVKRESNRRTLLTGSILLACCGFGLSAWIHNMRSPTYVTQFGEQRSITLTDGSTIDLNARSKIRVRFTRQERSVELLAGQALFRVMKDSTRPFVVETQQTRIRAVGTQFDVHRSSSETTVTVLEGRVAVLPARSQQTDAARATPSGEIGPGEQVTVTADRLLRPARADVVTVTAWVKRKLVFDSSRLLQVAEELNRHSHRQIIIDDARLEDMRIGGVYSSTDPASLVRFLRAQPGITVTETDTQIRISQQ